MQWGKLCYLVKGITFAYFCQNLPKEPLPERDLLGNDIKLIGLFSEKISVKRSKLTFAIVLLTFIFSIPYISYEVTAEMAAY
jgi:hypothetical protein